MDWKDQVAQVLPGSLGALAALRWISGSTWHLLLSLIGGAAFGFYGGSWAVAWADVDPGWARFLLGLFGMAAASRIMVAIDSFPVEKIAAWFRRPS